MPSSISTSGATTSSSSRPGVSCSSTGRTRASAPVAGPRSLMIPSMVLEGGGEPERWPSRSWRSMRDGRRASTRSWPRLAGYLHGARAQCPTRRASPPSVPSNAPRARSTSAGCARGWATRHRSSVRGHEHNAAPARRHRRHQGDRRRHPPHRAPRPVDAPRAARLGGAPPARARGRRPAGVDVRRQHHRERGRCRGDPARREEGRRHRVPRVPHRGRASGGVRRRRAARDDGRDGRLRADPLPERRRVRRPEVQRRHRSGAPDAVRDDLQRRDGRDPGAVRPAPVPDGDRAVVGHRRRGARGRTRARPRVARRQHQRRPAQRGLPRPRQPALGPALGGVRRPRRCR